MGKCASTYRDSTIDISNNSPATLNHIQCPVTNFPQHLLQYATMSLPPNARDAWSQLTKMAQNAQKKGGAPGPKGAGAGIGLLVLVGGGVMLANNALFNVDGGHRAIKYTRLGGVKQEIYAEGQ